VLGDEGGGLPAPTVGGVVTVVLVITPAGAFLRRADIDLAVSAATVSVAGALAFVSAPRDAPRSSAAKPAPRPMVGGDAGVSGPHHRGHHLSWLEFRTDVAVISWPLGHFLIVWLIAYPAMNGFATLFPVAMTRQFGMSSILPSCAYAVGVAASLLLYQPMGVATHRLGGGRILLSGMGESHLQIVVEGIKRKYSVDLETHDQRIIYRETIRKKARANGRHKRQSGGHGQFGDVWLEIEPLPRDSEQLFVFEDKIVGGVVPGQYIPGVEKGVRESLKKGFLSGNPMLYVKVAVVDGKYHPVDSSAQSFEVAASLGMQEAVPLANPVLLEPIMNVTITVPEYNMGDVMSDINTKRGRVLGMDSIGDGMQQITALVPQAEMLHYATDLRSITQGRGSFSMVFSQYEEVPANVQQEIVAKHKKVAA